MTTSLRVRVDSHRVVFTLVFSIFLESGYDTAKAIATEIKYGEAIIAECAKAQVQHIVYSGQTKSCEYTSDMFVTACLTSESEDESRTHFRHG